jgi:hypothetical protein
MSLQGTGASALPPLAIFHSLSALKQWHHCTQIEHRLEQRRRCCIPAQRRRTAMTRSPALLAPKKMQFLKVAIVLSPSIPIENTPQPHTSANRYSSNTYATNSIESMMKCFGSN